MAIYAQYAVKGGRDMGCDNCQRKKRCKLTPQNCSQKLAEQIVMEPDVKKEKREKSMMREYSIRTREKFLKKVLWR